MTAVKDLEGGWQAPTGWFDELVRFFQKNNPGLPLL
jgi:hypothetical protein